MKSKNTNKAKWNEQIKRQGNFLKKSPFIGVMASALFVLPGCQNQMASIKTIFSNHPVLVNEIPKPAQLASKVTFNNDPLEFNKKLWKETLDGMGVPLLMIAF